MKIFLMQSLNTGEVQIVPGKTKEDAKVSAESHNIGSFICISESEEISETSLRPIGTLLINGKSHFVNMKLGILKPESLASVPP